MPESSTIYWKSHLQKWLKNLIRIEQAFIKFSDCWGNLTSTAIEQASLKCKPTVQTITITGSKLLNLGMSFNSFSPFSFLDFHFSSKVYAELAWLLVNYIKLILCTIYNKLISLNLSSQIEKQCVIDEFKFF